MQDVISDWASHNQTEKDNFLEFASQTDIPTLSALQKTDIEAIIYSGFTIFENGAANVKKYWNGSAWV